MRRKLPIISVCIILVMAMFISLDISYKMVEEVKGITLYVDKDGGAEYINISDAIENASAGDTIFVYNGTYNEEVVINKTLTLIGEDRNNTIIQRVFGDVVRIEADWVNITGFTIRNGWRGIKLYNFERCNISDNKIVDLDKYCVGISNSNGNIISNNEMSYARGIALWNSDGNEITNNIFSTEEGIYSENSNGNIIIGNHISASDCSIKLLSSTSTIISNNTMMGTGIYIEGEQIEKWDTHEIDSLNTLNGTTIYYWKNKSGGTISPNAGQVILANCNNVIVENQNLVYGPVGVAIGFSFNNYITTSTISNNSEYGIFLESSYNNKIISNTLINNGEGIHIKSSDSNEIKYNSLYQSNYCLSLSYSDGNKILHNNGTGLFIEYSKDTQIKNNDLSRINVGGYSNNSIIANNKVSGYGIIIASYNNTIENNYIKNCGWGISVVGSNNKVIDNNISHNSGGISLASGNIVKGNIISFNNHTGVHFDISSNGNSVTHNNIYSNKQNGIYLFDCNGNNISHNIISKNKIGIHLDDIDPGYNTTISGNTISQNTGHGIYMRNWCFDVHIYHNNIINNTVQAYQEPFSIGNKWDNGYPSGGNYWSDYTGIDLNSTPAQNIPPPDGIGDTKYIFTDGGDNYPLMNPFKGYIFLHHGWNHISIPFTQPDTDLGTVLSSIQGDYDAVKWYDASDNSDPWKNNHVSKPIQLNDLNEIDHKVGFWIHIIEPNGVYFDYLGARIYQNQSIPLYRGWNLVSYPSFATYNRTKALNKLTFGAHVEAIWTFDSISQKYYELREDDYFQPGKGYYIHAQTDCVWEVPL